MNPYRRVDQELGSFIQYGGLMDMESRRITAENLFRHLYDPEYEAMEALDESDIPEKYPNWYRILSILIDKEDLRNLTRHNEDFSFSVTRETLLWCKQVYLEFEHVHAWQEEQHTLEALQSAFDATDTDPWKSALQNLKSIYPDQEVEWDFYLGKLEENLPEADFAAEFKILRHNILEQWSRHYFHKKHDSEERFLNESFDTYYSDLNSKVRKLQQLGDLLSPYYNFIGHVWNETMDNWNRVAWDKLEAYALTLQRDPHLKELAELLGRWNLARRSKEERITDRPLPRDIWRPLPAGKSEISGIHNSDDVNALLPGEVALLSSPETEVLFALKFAEKKLLTFQYTSQVKSSSVEIRQEKAEEVQTDGQGPFIICMDTSGSMFGEPERMAKALALAILEIALREKRRAYLISFSTGIKTFEMTGIEKDLTQMVDFLRMSFHGGTDIHPALTRTLELLDQPDWARADVLIISDFVIPQLGKQVFQDILRQRQERAVNFHSLYVSRRPDARAIPLPIFDNHWIYDLDKPGLMRQAVDHFEIFEHHTRRR
ncbi:MAG: VWA domain-containing protein [Bacteroidetes bacterium]|nr:MAG: VWA domain-containing protein [Bacteroidota bacterium]